MHIHRRIEIDCSPKILWKCLTDDELVKQWVSQLVDDIPDDRQRIGLGALSTLRLREGAKVVSYRSVVTEWEPERLLAIRLSGGSFAPGMEMDVRYEISQEHVTGTVLDMDVTVPLKGLLFKLLGPLVWLGSVSNAKKDLTKLKELASGM
jgi:hypothetical protein